MKTRDIVRAIGHSLGDLTYAPTASWRLRYGPGGSKATNCLLLQRRYKKGWMTRFKITVTKASR